MPYLYPRAWLDEPWRSPLATAMRAWRKRRRAYVLDFGRQPHAIFLQDGRTLLEALRQHRLWCNLSGQAGSRLILVDEDLSWLVAPRVDLSGSKLVRVKLRNATLLGSDLRCSWLDGVDLTGSDLSCSALSGTQFHKCQLEDSLLCGARVDGAVFARCEGLYGVRRARIDNVQRSEEAFASKERFLWADEPAKAGVATLAYGSTSLWARQVRVGGLAQRARAMANVLRSAVELSTSWDALRSIGGLLVAGSASLSVAAIVAYGRFRDWYNYALAPYHGAPREPVLPVIISSPADIASAVAKVAEAIKTKSVTSLPYPLPMPVELLLLLVAFGLTALGSLVFFLKCPRLVKENSRLRWHREFKLPILEYEAANYSSPIARAGTAVLYAVGGTYLVGYIAVRAALVLWSNLVPFLHAASAP